MYKKNRPFYFLLSLVFSLVACNTPAPVLPVKNLKILPEADSNNTFSSKALAKSYLQRKFSNLIQPGQGNQLVKELPGPITAIMAAVMPGFLPSATILPEQWSMVSLG
jgi:hypothetical protein